VLSPFSTSPIAVKPSGFLRLLSSSFDNTHMR
jgi:hypothetical protein